MARNLKLVNADGVDPTDIDCLVASITRDCRSDQEKMIALWSYIAGNPFYHWCEAREGPEAGTELGLVFDPIAAFNVHGTTICYQVAFILANLAEAAGIRARAVGVPGHVVTEAFYDGSWHLFDAQYDCAAYYVDDDGRTVISLEQLCRNAGKYIRTPTHPSRPFFQFDHFGGKFWPWESKEYCIEHFFHPGVPEQVQVCPAYQARGHTLCLDLRRGEKLIRRFDNEGKWYGPPELRNRWRRDLTQRWVDAGPHDPRDPRNTYANGDLIYEPDWQAAEENFYDGLYDGENFALADGKVRPSSAGEGFVVFRMHSPYLIAGRPGKSGEGAESTDGAVLEAEFFRKDASAGIAVAVSTDNGRCWRGVWTSDRTGRTAERLDLTSYVEGTYGYLVKVTLSGRPDEVSVSKLRLRNSLFFSPVCLPAVRPGQNRFQFSVREGEGILRIQPDLSPGSDLRGQFFELKGLTYDPKYVRHLFPQGKPRRGAPRAQTGHAVLKVAAPPGARLEALSVHVCFGVDIRYGQAESAEILYATEPAGPWKSAWRSDFADRNDKWRRDHTVQIELQPPAEVCYVKIVLRRRHRLSLNMVRIHAHYRRSTKPLEPGNVRITHEWTEAGRPRRHVARPEPSGQQYAFNAADREVRNVAVAIEVANEGPRPPA